MNRTTTASLMALAAGAAYVLGVYRTVKHLSVGEFVYYKMKWGFADDSVQIEDRRGVFGVDDGE